MAQELPTYQKSVRLDVTAQPDTDSSAQMLINSFKQFSSLVNETTNTITKREAEERRDILKNNISTSYRQFAQSSLLHPDQNKGLADYDLKSKDYAQQLLHETDPFNKAYVKNLLEYYSNSHRDPIVKNAMAQNKRVQQTDFILRDANSGNDVIAAVQDSDPSLGDNQFDSADSLFTQRIQALRQQVTQGNITPAAFASSYKQYHKQLVTEKVLKKYKDAVQKGESTDYLKSLINTNIPGFDESDKASLFLQINKINDQHLTEYGLTHAKLNEQKKADLKNIEENGAEPNVQLAEINAQVNPLDAADYEKQQKMAYTIWSIKEAAKNSTPQQLQDLKDRLRPTDANDPDFPTQKYMYDRAFAAVNKQMKEYRSDPMEFDKDQPFLTETSRNYQLAQDVNATGTNEKTTTLNNHIEKPWDSAIQHQQARGLSIFGNKESRVKLLTNLQASDYIRLIEQANPREKIQLFNKLKNEFDGGVRYNLVIKQLQDLGLNNKLSFLGLFNPDDPDTQNVVDAMTLPTKELGAALKSKNETWYKRVNTDIASSVYNNKGGTPNFKSYLSSSAAYAGGRSEDFLASVEEVTQSLAYHYLNIGIANSPQDGIRRAQDAIAKRYNYTTIHNQMVNIPKDYDTDTIKNYALEKEQKELKDFPFVVTKSTQGGELRSEQAAKLDHDLIMKGHWVGGTNDHGLVWVDFNGRLPLDKEGHPFYFSFNDAQYGFKTVHPTEVTNAFPSFFQQFTNANDKAVSALLRSFK